MTFINKVLTYLGFCPSKESAQRFRARNNTTSLKQGVVGVGFILIFILLVNASNIYASAVTADTILRLFSLIVLSLILVIITIGGLIVRARNARFQYDHWRKASFVGIFTLTLYLGATSGLFFISPTDSWAEIIAETLAISLAITAVEIIGAEAYLRWRKDKE